MEIAEIVEKIRRASEFNDQLQVSELIRDAYHAVVRTESVEELRRALPGTWDFSIPTKLAFAMHVQLLCRLGGEAQDIDRSKFAEFLSAYYEEFEDWANALRTT